MLAVVVAPTQNNNRGGYNAGDQDTGAFNSEDEIYYMVNLSTFIMHSITKCLLMLVYKNQ